MKRSKVVTKSDSSKCSTSDGDKSDSPLISSQDEAEEARRPSGSPGVRRPRGRPRKSIGPEKLNPKFARDGDGVNSPKYTPMSTSNDDNSDSPLISSQEEEEGGSSMAAPLTSAVPRPRGRPRKSAAALPSGKKDNFRETTAALNSREATTSVPVNDRITSRYTRKSAREADSSSPVTSSQEDESGASMNSPTGPRFRPRKSLSIPKNAREIDGAASPKYTPMSTSNDDVSDSPLISSQEEDEDDPFAAPPPAAAKRPRGRPPRSASRPKEGEEEADASPPRKSSKLTPYSLARKFRDPQPLEQQQRRRGRPPKLSKKSFRAGNLNDAGSKSDSDSNSSSSASSYNTRKRKLSETAAAAVAAAGVGPPPPKSARQCL